MEMTGSLVLRKRRCTIPKMVDGAKRLPLKMLPLANCGLDVIRQA
jgi:hypothetical protein